MQIHPSLLKFFGRYPVKHFSKDEIIIYQGETPPTLYAVKSGYVKAYDINSEGSEQLVWFGSPPDIFPIVFFDEQDVGSTIFFYSAFTDVELYAITAKDLGRYLKENAVALYDIYRLTSHRYIELMRRLGAVEKPKASDKIIHTLDYLVSRYSGKVNGQETEVSLQLTHQDIANLVGLTRETTAMELKKLKDRGVIYYDKWHFTVNRTKLQDLL